MDITVVMRKAEIFVAPLLGVINCPRSETKLGVVHFTGNLSLRGKFTSMESLEEHDKLKNISVLVITRSP